MKKKLIEVALPLEAINREASRRKRKAPAGYPTTLHKWWAQRPIAAARAVLFAQMVDDPSAHPDLFPTEKAQEKERQRLFRIIEDLVQWENTNNEEVLERARAEIWQSWRRTCAENADHPRAKELFNRHKLPAFHDPFAGGGSIPLEAQRLGLEAYASDLNPVAVLINKAMIEIPPKFVGKPPVNPKARAEKGLLEREWRGAKGLAEDVRYYGQWMRDEAEKRIGHLYPKIEITAEMAKERPDLKPLVGQKLTVIAWLWARTVKSPNPAFAHVDVPLAATFMLSSKAGKEAYVQPVLDSDAYKFTVKIGKPRSTAAVQSGTRLARESFRCLFSGAPIPYAYIDDEANAGRMGARLMAIVAEGKNGRIYLSPTEQMEDVALSAEPPWKPDLPSRGTWASNAQGRCYGFRSFSDYFTPRQLLALTTFCDLLHEARDRVRYDALAAGLPNDGDGLRAGGTGASAYADAVATFLAVAISRLADYGSSLATWRPKDSAMRSSLPKQAIQMTWDFAEGSPFGTSSAGFGECVEVVARVIATALGRGSGVAFQRDATRAYEAKPVSPIVSTDPPYFDNVGYADLSDFFYAWLRPALKPVFPELFATLVVPKTEELVATQYRHGDRANAEAFFLHGMTQAMCRLAESAHPAFPITIYYAFRQSETENDVGTASTGWEMFLEAVIRSGLGVTGTWPMRTEGDNRQVGIGSNALASSIVLVCRPRPADAPAATRREFVNQLKAELLVALSHLQRSNIAPVDLAQAAIGPGMAVYTRYAKVLDAEGKPVSVREALALINQILDEVLAEQESEFDRESRWAVAWFEQHGFKEGPYGVAETLANAKDVSIAALADAGMLTAKAGKVRLYGPLELPVEWDPSRDQRLTVWKAALHLVRQLENGGESAAAQLLALLSPGVRDAARDLAYRAYTICERRKWAKEALSFNALVIAWPEITRLAQQAPAGTPTQGELL